MYARLPQGGAGAEGSNLQVLIGSFDLGGSREWIEVIEAEFLGLTSEPQGALAILRLAHPSGQLPLNPTVDPEEFRQRLIVSADVWAALDSMGAVPDFPGNLPSADLIGPPPGVPPIETTTHWRLVQKPGGVQHWWCMWFGGCHPVGPEPRP